MQTLGAVTTLVVLLLLAVPVHAQMGFHDSNQADWAQGNFDQTINLGKNVSLTNETSNAFYTIGNFTRVLDAGKVVNWSRIEWGMIVNSGLNDITFQTRGSNNSANWSNYSANHNTGGPIGTPSRYLEYKGFFITFNNQTRPYLNYVTINYTLLPPWTILETPTDNTTVGNQVTFRCRGHTHNTLTNITLYLNSGSGLKANVTAAASGTSQIASFPTTLSNGEYEWNCLTTDTTGQSTFAAKDFLLNVTSNPPPPSSGNGSKPNITAYSISPKKVQNGSNVTLSITASDSSGVSAVWATITAPGNTNTTIPLINGSSVHYTPTALGSYSVTFFANNTGGNISSVTDTFSVVGNISFSFEVGSRNNSKISVVVTVLKKNSSTVVNKTTQSNISNSTFSGTLPDDDYDLLFSVFGGDFVVKLLTVPLSSTANKLIEFDELSTPVSGYLSTHAVKTTISFASAQVTVSYDGLTFSDENVLNVYKCSNWNFNTRQCSGSWLLTPVLSRDKNANTITVSTSGFSAFAIKENASCGNQICDAGETVNSCSQDCQCAGNQQQSCGQSQTGECQLGIQTCSNGRWGACVGSKGPTTDICDGKDNNCDGVIDNVNSGTNVQSAKCQCYDGGKPLNETCNNIDDNCNGVVDENIVKACGSDIGICKPGTQICTAGTFGTCVGGVRPKTTDICENGLDDNCNGVAEDGCATCNDGIENGKEEGVDCGGGCPNECFQFPFLLLSVVGLIILVGIFVFLMIRKRKQPSWADLEKKYRTNKITTKQ